MTERAKPAIVLVTGGRDYRNKQHVWSTLDSVATYYPGFACVQGGASGADALAKAWAVAHGHPSFTCDAAWDFYGPRNAGPIRNGFMVEFMRIDLLIWFPGGAGTANMIKQASSLNIPCYEG